jgi:hypothetical protein
MPSGIQSLLKRTHVLILLRIDAWIREEYLQRAYVVRPVIRASVHLLDVEPHLANEEKALLGLEWSLILTGRG